MQKFAETMAQYFLVLDKSVVIAGILMLMMFVLIVYVLSVAAIAFRKRKEAISISLPDIEKESEIENKAQFKESEDISIELISPEEDNEINEVNIDNEDTFLTSLVLETGQFVSKVDTDVDMPIVGELDEEAILNKKDQDRREKLENDAKERELELKSIAMADDKAEADEAEKILSDLMKEIHSGEADVN